MRVTTPLRRYSPYKSVSDIVLENASARGTWVHDACSLVAQGIFVAFAVTEYYGYVASFEKWKNTNVVKVIAVEPEIIDEKLGLTGHPDFLFELKQSKLALIDIKTPIGKQNIWEAQLAAYFHLVSNCSTYGKPDLTASLQLDSLGGIPKMRILEKPEDHWWGYYHAFMAEKYFNPEGLEE